MGHDLKTKMPVLPPLQRKKKFELKPFNAGDHVCTLWDTERLIEMLESRARGYSGTLRQILCSSAHALRAQKAVLLAYEEAADAAATELDEVVNEMRNQEAR
jgi:hypothetical protein